MMHTELTHFCAKGGHIIGSDAWLPEHAYDYQWGAVTPPIGCNRLVCESCGGAVRSRAGVELVPGETLMPDELRGLSEDQWEGLAQIVPSNVGRIYACPCMVRVAFADDPLIPSEGELQGPSTAWRCAGHPDLKLPATLDGVYLAGDGSDDWAGLVSSSLRGVLPAADKRPWIGLDDARHSAFWLARLPMLVDDLVLARAVATQAAACLDSADVLVRRGAINFYRFHPNALGAGRVAALMETNPELYRGVSDPDRPRRDLARYADEVIDRRVSLRDAGGQPLAPEAVRYARNEVLQGRARMAHLFRLALLDGEWLATRAGKIVDAQPAMAGIVVMALRDGPEATLLEAVAALKTVTSLRAEDLQATVESNITDPGRRAKAMVIIGTV